MTLAYPPDLQRFVDDQISAGEFRSEEEFAVFAAALYRDLSDRHQELRQHVQLGIAEIERGEGSEVEGSENLRNFLDDLKSQGRQRLQQAGFAQ